VISRELAPNQKYRHWEREEFLPATADVMSADQQTAALRDLVVWQWLPPDCDGVFGSEL